MCTGWTDDAGWTDAEMMDERTDDAGRTEIAGAEMINYDLFDLLGVKFKKIFLKSSVSLGY